jgi:hypothetical protein
MIGLSFLWPRESITRLSTKAEFPADPDLISAQLKAAASNPYLPNADKGKAERSESRQIGDAQPGGSA